MYSQRKSQFSALLHRLGKRFSVDMLYVFRGGSYLGISQIVSSGCAFVTSIAFANLLLPETLGLYKYIISITNILNITTLSGMDSAITRSVSRGFDGTMEAGFRAKFRWGLLGSLASIGLSIYYLYAGNNSFAVAFGLVAIFVPFFESYDVYNSFLFAKGLFSIQSIYNIFRKFFGLILIVITLYFTQDLYKILAANFLGLILPALYYYGKSLRLYKKNDKVEAGAIAYGKHLSINGVFALIIGEIDKVLIFHYLGAVNLAVYSLAIAPVDQIKGLLKNINQMALPRFAKYDLSTIRSNIWPKVRILLATSAVLTLIYIALTPLFYGWFFPKYLAAIHLSMVFAISMIPAIIANFLYTILESQKASREIYLFNISSNTLSLAILFPMIYFFGLWGAIFARLISRSVTLLLSIILVGRAKD